MEEEKTFVERCRDKARAMGANIVIVRSGGRLATVHFTRQKTLSAFRLMRPTIGDLSFETINETPA